MKSVSGLSTLFLPFLVTYFFSVSWHLNRTYHSIHWNASYKTFYFKCFAVCFKYQRIK